MDIFAADAIFIDAPPARVLEAILRPEDILVWMDARSAEVEACHGGALKIVRQDGTTLRGRIELFQPADRLEIVDAFLETPGSRLGPMKITFTLELRDGGVWIVVRQDGLDVVRDWKPFAEAVRKDLKRQTVALKRHVEGI